MRPHRNRNAIVAVAALASVIVGGTIMVTTSSFAQMGGQHGWGDDYWMPGWMQRHMWAPRSSDADMRARMQRHWTFIHQGVPQPYQNTHSTVRQTPEAIKDGGDLYTDHCASCHGRKGLGDGEAGKGLTPSPALLAYMIQRPVAVDEYMLWTIAEGGKEFNTAMPAFKDSLTREQIWKVVAYMRAGFPDTAKK
ncbi:MAG: hypothetical protein RLZ98_598 [Pseudomonadota bacterium]|jgi:mono/diheme cytochrome c family protein